MKNGFMSLITILFIISCKGQNMQVVETKTSVGGGVALSGSVVGFDKVKPIFEAKCSMCHNGGVHPKNWTLYETAKTGLTKLNERLFVVANMPLIGSLSADEKKIIQAWISAGGPLASSASQGQVAVVVPSVNPEDKPVIDTPIQSNNPIERGEFIVQTKCLSCHGESASGMKTPVLHGQFPKYIIAELNNFKNDLRQDHLMGAMNNIAKSLSETDISDIAAYLEKQNPCSIPIANDPGQGDVALGKMKVDQNACMGCHRVKNTYGAPKLDGQKTEYVLHSLKLFRNNQRTSHYMNPLTVNFKDEDLNDLAAYMNSLRKCE